MKVKLFLFAILMGTSSLSSAQQSNTYSYDANAAANLSQELGSLRSGNSGWLQRFPYNPSLFDGTNVSQQVAPASTAPQTGGGQGQGGTQAPPPKLPPSTPYNVPGGNQDGGSDFNIRY